ncbi:hypothetical protein M2360_003892 [Rhizobium sp. SG_E_25_P2]|uniref:hypothetical protein n=1 Tax=Rhizobium sp. SG_E_25_P2 TaxID=2879942 RepID=UPI002476F4A2|nr:hypothetical protein [Rhizobium sp. SG_E_25_P2]MDH6268486.1 hypothetical protein [Rhizobium sp. SG_E_25_P2]
MIEAMGCFLSLKLSDDERRQGRSGAIARMPGQTNRARRRTNGPQSARPSTLSLRPFEIPQTPLRSPKSEKPVYAGGNRAVSLCHAPVEKKPSDPIAARPALC